MARRKIFLSSRSNFKLGAVVLPKTSWVILVLAAYLLSAKPTCALGQDGASTGRFRIAEKSADSRRISILTGTEAVFQADGMLALTDPRLVTVTADGKTNLVFTASECLFDQDKKTIRSPGALSLTTGDGQMQLKGVGFSGNLVGPTLSVSSNIEANLDKGFTRSPLGQTQKIKESSNNLDPLQITSQRFYLEPGRVVFSGMVSVSNNDEKLSSDSITVGMRGNEWEMQNIRAIGSVVLQADRIKTTSEQAEYDLAAELIVFKGNPRWTIGKRSGFANLLMIHLESQSVNAEGDVVMELPAGSALEGGLLDFTTFRDDTTVEHPVEIRSNVFLFQSATQVKTGFARYIGSVRLARGESQLNCSFLNVRLAKGSRGVVESINAAVGVRLVQGKDHLKAQTASYDLVQNKIWFRGEPIWNWGMQRGQARLVELSPTDGLFRAIGKVRMQLPRPEGDGNFLLPAKRKPVENSEYVGEPLWAFCDSFEYKRASEANRLDEASFNGNVVLTDNDGLRVQANQVSTRIDSGVAGLVLLDATGGLVATSTGENALQYTGDRLVYSASKQTVRLTGKPSVGIRAQRDGLEWFALGQAAFYNLGTGWLRMNGDPVLKTVEGKLSGREIVFNPQSKQIKAIGRWKMVFNPKTFAKMRERNKKEEEKRP